MIRWTIFSYRCHNKNHNYDVIEQLLLGGIFDVGARESINGIQSLSFSEIIIRVVIEVVEFLI